MIKFRNMSKLIEPRILSGFRDFLPEEMGVRNRVIEILKSVFEKYGFDEIQTPALEYQDILLGKYGEEAEKLMYLFEDQGKRSVGMRYDLTVPVARVVAQYPTLPKPFKRYQIQSVYRADKPQKGRYREVTQCDIDTFGTPSPLADAEILAVIYESLKSLDFRQFTIRINSRNVLYQIMRDAGVSENKYLTAITAIDKLDKKTRGDVEVELEQKGVSKGQITDIFGSIEDAKPDENLEEIMKYARLMGVPDEYCRFDPTLSRGLDYYTGAIFETVVTEPKIGSITGGGRYDELIGQFTGQSVPAVGTTLGLDRIVDVITDLKLRKDLPKTVTRVLVTVFSQDFIGRSVSETSKLREKNIDTEIYLEPGAKLDKQLKYADQKGIPYVIIIGPDEAAKNLVTVKNLKAKNQRTVSAEDVTDEIE